MRSPIRYQRQFMLQIHLCIHACCFVITLLCILALRFSIGLLELLSLIVPMVGILSLFMNFSIGKGRKVMKDCYLVGSLSTILSLFLTSQVLLQFCCSSWLVSIFFFLLTGIAIGAIGYFIFFGDIQFFYKCMTPVTLIATVLVGLLIAIVIYRFFLIWWFDAGFILFISYFLFIIDLILTIFICLDLRLMLWKGR